MLVVLALTAACGGGTGDAVRTGDEPAPPALTSEGLDAHVLNAEVQGPLASSLRVEPLPAGLLLPGRPALGLLTFSADEEEVALPELPFHDGTAEVEGGGGTLGHTGICGYGWGADGRQITEDPCAAASPAGLVAPGFPTQLGIVLYPRTEAGPAVAGRYTVRVPLDETSTLVVSYELRPHDPATPAWAAPDASLTINAEEVMPTPPGGIVAVLLEDPFGHEYDTVEFTPPGDVRVELPAGVWRIIPKLPDDTGAMVRCGNGDQQVVLEAGDAQPITILVRADAEGRCAS